MIVITITVGGIITIIVATIIIIAIITIAIMTIDDVAFTESCCRRAQCR